LRKSKITIKYTDNKRLLLIQIAQKDDELWYNEYHYKHKKQTIVKDTAAELGTSG